MSRIESSQERMKQSLTDDTHNRSILQRLLDIDEQTAIAMAMDMLIAGIDTVTTESTFKYTFQAQFGWNLLIIVSTTQIMI